MGLLDSVLSAIEQSQGSPAAASHGDLINALIALLGQGQSAGGIGGLAGLVQRFQQAGLGEIVNSWISTGQNLPVSADQVRQGLGSDMLGRLAQQLGLDHSQLAGQLAQALPHLVDQLTPNGQLPQGGIGEIASLVGGLFNRG
jgi:uncharacterized protein YidB (DUF937 family)